MNVQRIHAIFEKDIKDFMKNMMLITMPFIPIVLSLMYTRFSDGGVLPISMLYIIVGATYSAVTSSIMMTMMSEENEKKTLRGLVQSPASYVDILVGKSLVVALVSFTSLLISLLIVGIDPFLNLKDVIALLLLFIFFLLLGIGIGLFSKSVASTSAYIMPVMFLFGFTPMLEALGIAKESAVSQVASVFPLMQAIHVHENNSWVSLGIIALWSTGAAVFAYICFKKTTTDD
ncbi:ABC transporter permease [Virgibacillus halodenitrificans]|uniref:ABC transporter permease n=1 Tax=Virgibacillus halodenitrificans TaxID=1482 RepID=UPI00045C9D74|nr:ABC transporter permease [Virgibacillus halodenitrificans]CDQ32634.1 ABC-type transport system involved in multi-copper enzyme maturation, permease component [Virgibacillus halodenitrificans]